MLDGERESQPSAEGNISMVIVVTTGSVETDRVKNIK
jgi:hypothetical protein